jgi:hypothetical protein
MSWLAIIPAIRREFLAHAIASALSRMFDKTDCEVIVVNDSGGPLHRQAWRSSEWIQVIGSNRCERRVGRNVGVAIPRGSLRVHLRSVICTAQVEI